jgi:flagellar basal-body rod modification protein FlgD
MTINSVSDNSFSFLNKAENTAVNKDDGALATEDFLALMTTQLQNQDPLKPLESGDFLGQIASFSTVSGIGELNDSFDGFAQSMQSDQALRGSALVGRSVLVPSSLGNLTAGESIEGQINVADPVPDLKVQIYNESGAPVRTIAMGPAAGYTNFAWDGLDDDGQALPSGTYQYKASGTVNGDNTAFATATVAKVDSVLVGNGSQGLTINLAGIGSVPFSEVQEII